MIKLAPRGWWKGMAARSILLATWRGKRGSLREIADTKMRVSAPAAITMRGSLDRVARESGAPTLRGADLCGDGITPSRGNPWCRFGWRGICLTKCKSWAVGPCAGFGAAIAAVQTLNSKTL